MHRGENHEHHREHSPFEKAWRRFGVSHPGYPVARAVLGRVEGLDEVVHTSLTGVHTDPGKGEVRIAVMAGSPYPTDTAEAERAYVSMVEPLGDAGDKRTVVYMFDPAVRSRLQAGIFVDPPTELAYDELDFGAVETDEIVHLAMLLGDPEFVDLRPPV